MSLRSIKILTIRQIPIYLHWSFLLLLAWAAYLTIDAGHGLSFFGWYIGMMSSIFVCILLHELGHAFMANRYDIKTKDIILSPLGGLARLEKNPTTAISEFLIAFAGPLVNVIIILIVGSVLWSLGTFKFLFDESVSYIETFKIWFQGDFFFLKLLLVANLILVLFNLIPAFPTDGGRIFRAALSHFIGRTKATFIATLVGQIFACLLIGFGIYDFSIFTIIIGVALIFIARTEYQQIKFQDLISQLTAQDVMHKNFTILSEQLSFFEVVAEIKEDKTRPILVSNDDGKFKGVLKLGSIENIEKEKAYATKIEEQIEDNIFVISPNAPIGEIIFLMQKGYSFIPVVFKEKAIGIVDIHSLSQKVKF